MAIGGRTGRAAEDLKQSGRFDYVDVRSDDSMQQLIIYNCYMQDQRDLIAEMRVPALLISWMLLSDVNSR